jgi:hypothetical protein
MDLEALGGGDCMAFVVVVIAWPALHGLVGVGHPWDRRGREVLEAGLDGL